MKKHRFKKIIRDLRMKPKVVIKVRDKHSKKLLALLDEKESFECIDCHNKFTYPKLTHTIITCPFCPRRYYVDGDLIKPIHRRKWWKE